MSFNDNQAQLSDVLYEFALAQPIPDAELLERYARLYPEHAGALTDLAIGIVLDAARGDDEDASESAATEVSPTVSRAMSRFQNRLFEVRQKSLPAVMHAGTVSTTAPNPFAELSRTEFRSLAKQLHCNPVFLAMVRDREIDPETITPGFTKTVADEIHIPVGLLAAHFAGRSEVRPEQYYKADEKPQSGQKVSFEEAVRGCGLTEEQQKFLLSL